MWQRASFSKGFALCTLLFFAKEGKRQVSPDGEFFRISYPPRRAEGDSGGTGAPGRCAASAVLAFPQKCPRLMLRWGDFLFVQKVTKNTHRG